LPGRELHLRPREPVQQGADGGAALREVAAGAAARLEQLLAAKRQAAQAARNGGATLRARLAAADGHEDRDLVGLLAAQEAGRHAARGIGRRDAEAVPDPVEDALQ